MKESKRINLLQKEITQNASKLPNSKKDLKENWATLPHPQDTNPTPNKDMLLNLYNRSIEFQSVFQNWKQSTLDPGKFDITQFAEEKAQKLQEAMRMFCIIIAYR